VRVTAGAGHKPSLAKGSFRASARAARRLRAMEISPTLLRKTAVWLVVAPCLVALAAQVCIWVIPGCKPNPYGLGKCLIRSYNAAAFLLVLQLGGVYLAMCLGVLVSAPVLMIAAGMGFWSKRSKRA